MLFSRALGVRRMSSKSGLGGVADVVMLGGEWGGEFHLGHTPQ